MRKYLFEASAFEDFVAFGKTDYKMQEKILALLSDTARILLQVSVSLNHLNTGNIKDFGLGASRKNIVWYMLLPIQQFAFYPASRIMNNCRRIG